MDKLNENKQAENRRRWSKKEKLIILREAAIPGSNIAAVARKHVIGSSLLFAWKRQLEADGSIAGDGIIDAATEYRSMIATISDREALLDLAVRKLNKEAETNQITAYNMCCSINNLVSATSKLQERRIDLIERLAAIEAENDQPNIECELGDHDLEVQRTAERVTVELIRRELDERRPKTSLSRCVGSR